MSQLFGGDLLEALGAEGTAFRLSLRQLWETQWADDGAFLFPCNTLGGGRGAHDLVLPGGWIGSLQPKQGEREAGGWGKRALAPPFGPYLSG